jgi:multisubunit Na+/H+ antiporter MnhF subunit
MIFVSALSFLFIAYGLFMAIRFLKPNWSKKFIAMQSKHGKLIGFIIHFAAYTVLPILCDILLLILIK